jgi:hypothetical protein
MRCQEAFELMSAALDRETAVPAARRDGAGDGAGDGSEGLRQHLLSCEPCRIQQVTLGVINGRLRQLRGRPATPAGLRARIHQQCRQNNAGCGHADRSRQAPAQPGHEQRTKPAAQPGAQPGAQPEMTARPRPRSRTTWGMGLSGTAAALFALFLLGTGPHGGIMSSAGSGAPAGGSSSAVSEVSAGGRADSACRLAIAGGSPVAVACATDGRRGARQVMERLTELARSRGLDVQCASCHLDERNFQLLGGAREKFASLLEATRT